MYFAAERVVARSTRVAESGGGRNLDISTDICEEIDRLVRDRVALYGSLTELDAKKRLEEVAHCFLDGGEKALGKKESRVCGWKMRDEM